MAKQYSTGDVVTVTLDMVEDNLSFSVNGEDQGIAYSGCFKGRTIYPAVSLYGPGEHVTIQSYSAKSTIFVSEEEIEIASEADAFGSWSCSQLADKSMLEEMEKHKLGKVFPYKELVFSVPASYSLSLGQPKKEKETELIEVDVEAAGIFGVGNICTWLSAKERESKV